MSQHIFFTQGMTPLINVGKELRLKGVIVDPDIIEQEIKDAQFQGDLEENLNLTVNERITIVRSEDYPDNESLVLFTSDEIDRFMIHVDGDGSGNNLSIYNFITHDNTFFFPNQSSVPVEITCADPLPVIMFANPTALLTSQLFTDADLTSLFPFGLSEVDIYFTSARFDKIIFVCYYPSVAIQTSSGELETFPEEFYHGIPTSYFTSETITNVTGLTTSRVPYDYSTYHVTPTVVNNHIAIHYKIDPNTNGAIYPNGFLMLYIG